MTSNHCESGAAVADITFHYPPELLNLLIDTIPLLNRKRLANPAYQAATARAKPAP
jgi:hypothetical protein